MARGPTPEELAELGEHACARPVDPHPELPTIGPAELRDGDVLLMLGEGKVPLPPLPVEVPVSWITRALDGGGYAHAAAVTWEAPAGAGAPAPRIWDHSEAGARGGRARPARPRDAARALAWRTWRPARKRRSA